MAQTRLFITSGASWTVPADFNSGDNTIETVGAGAPGSGAHPGVGGAYSAVVNQVLMPGAVVQVNIGSNTGASPDTWFDGTSLGSCRVGAQGGANGGDKAAGTGTTKTSGGLQGTGSSAGAGGAAGPHGDGKPGGAAGSGTGPGGDADAGHDGVGGVPAYGSSESGDIPVANGKNGRSGTYWGAGHGLGGGASGASGLSSRGGDGGLYGGAGSVGATPGRGAQGIIVITYTPVDVPKVVDTLGLTDRAQAIGTDRRAVTDMLPLGDVALVNIKPVSDADSFGLTDRVEATRLRGPQFLPELAMMVLDDTVGLVWGVTFDFASGPMAVWQGMGPLDTTPFDGPVFEGLGALGAIGVVELGAVQATQSITFTLSGLDARIYAKTQNQGVEIRGRRASLYLIAWNIRTSRLVDAHIRRTVVMDKLVPKVDTGTSPPSMICTLTCEPILSPKNKAPFALLDDQDQQARYPGDRGLERTQLLTHNQTLTF